MREERETPKPWKKTEVIGKPIPRVDAYERVSGSAIYPSDISLPGMLYGAILRCPHAHAKVRDIDTREAEKMPGVRTMIKDGTNGADVEWPYLRGFKTKLFDPHCRHEGEEVAAVAAETPYQAWDAIKAIKEAQLIILGPGSLYTSIIPNLLIKEISDAIISTTATKVYVCNAMTQPGETDGYSASDHVKALVTHAHPRVLDYCVVNTGEIPQKILQRYAKENSYLVINDRRKIENMGYRVIEDDFGIVSDSEVIRHDPLKLARIILGFIEEV